MTTQFFTQTRSLLALRGGFVNNLAEARHINQDCPKQMKTHDHVELILCYLQLLRLGLFVTALTQTILADIEYFISMYGIISLFSRCTVIYCLLRAVLSCFSHVRLVVTLWTIAHQTPLSMRFSRQE